MPTRNIVTMHKGNKFLFCPLQEVAKDFERKWSFQIIFVIGNHKDIRFGLLQKELRHISPKTLSDSLLALEKEQLVKKHLTTGSPQKIKYKLTKDGITLHPIIKQLLRWSASRKKSVVKYCLCDSKPKDVP